MRALLDANLLVSYLLDPRQPERTVNLIVEAAVRGDFTLVMPERVLAELGRAIATKPYIRDRVAPDDVAEFVDLIAQISERAAEITFPVPRIARDPDDDYLLAAVLLNDVDVLVSGDKDLLVLADQVEDLEILSPRQFLDRLNRKS